MSETDSKGTAKEPPLPEAVLQQEPPQSVAILNHQESLEHQPTCSSQASPVVQHEVPQLPQLPHQQSPGEQSPLIESPQTHPASDEDSLVENSTPISSAIEPDESTQSVPALTERASIEDELAGLYGENILAKVYRTATKSLIGEQRFPNYFPEYVPQDGKNAGNYTLREAEFWTCGFFPGTLTLLLERTIKFPRKICISNENSSKVDKISIETIRLHLQTLCDTWTRPLHSMASRTDTHDLGFIVMPSLRLDWELNGNIQSLNSIISAAWSLATTYVPASGAIRSWDLLLKKNLEIRDQKENMIIIIDSLCNLDLLYYAAEHCRNGKELYDIATSHATVLLRSHLREEKPIPLSKRCYMGPWYSTCHVANIDPRTGELKARLTHQGYDNESTWARGQAWAILGYAQTFMSTKDRTFVRAACGLAEYFLYRLDMAPEYLPIGSRYVPLWDFDAPIDDTESPLRDSSAGAIAANGLLMLSQAMASLGQDDLAGRYRRAAVDIIRDLLGFAQAPEKAHLVKGSVNAIEAEDKTLQRFDGILKYGTANNNQYSKRRYANHGLVYGDYYLVAFGNRLLQMGLV
ncbi:hypothetical protein N0V84_012493 [Fusarium piperis]|uniref:Unsaturated glucuronyl hydrolase n=1 Tax=Fusarium piperis TaxID=1435070 RepID=A0A9W8TBI1_9HYPO|nr:hypothetical protein N0V84_012493 [Fusarium piperis]